MIKNLANARGNGTSMISLVMPPTEDLHKINQMLTNEFGTASNIKSRVNRLSVLSAIKSTQERLKLYNNMPLNGLVIFCGTILTENNKEKKDLEKIILCDVQIEIYPELEKSLLDLLHNSGYPDVKFEKQINFEELYNQRFS